MKTENSLLDFCTIDLDRNSQQYNNKIVVEDEMMMILDDRYIYHILSKIIIKDISLLYSANNHFNPNEMKPTAQLT